MSSGDRRDALDRVHDQMACGITRGRGGEGGCVDRGGFRCIVFGIFQSLTGILAENPSLQ